MPIIILIITMVPFVFRSPFNYLENERYLTHNVLLLPSTNNSFTFNKFMCSLCCSIIVYNSCKDKFSILTTPDTISSFLSAPFTLLDVTLPFGLLLLLHKSITYLSTAAIHVDEGLVAIFLAFLSLSFTVGE